jgi:GrpB-like predicted nucleotidyltransferase (UPF0157 family)
MEILLVEYDADWPGAFKRECDLLTNVLGDTASGIEHVGSTSVRGLISKPIIDIMIGLRDFGEADRLVVKIEKLGYDYYQQYEDVMPYRRFFKKVHNATATHHIHMVEIDSEFWKRHLLFRDYLRDNPDTADEYAQLKKNLARQDWQDMNEFADAKTEFIRRIEKLAGYQR